MAVLLACYHVRLSQRPQLNSITSSDLDVRLRHERAVWGYPNITELRGSPVYDTNTVRAPDWRAVLFQTEEMNCCLHDDVIYGVEHRDCLI